MTQLASKRVLLVAPMGQYANAIAQSIVSLGGMVDSFEERPALSFLAKFAIRYFPRLAYFYSRSYFDRILASTKQNHYDYLLIIRAEAVTRKFLLDLKWYHPNIKLILYQWDSMSLTRGPLDKLDLFDVLVSFDKRDCEKYAMHFLPLFYTNDYRTIDRMASGMCYDFAFIGTMHSDRYKFICQIQRLAEDRHLTTYFYMYLTSTVAYYKMKYFDMNLPGANRSEFQFKHLNKELVLNVIAQSRVIVDVEHPAQVGLTIRTIEMLGAKKKMITTNTDIINYDFFTPNNILVVDRKDVQVPNSFLESDYVDIDPTIYEKYSTDSWVKNLFNLV